MSRMKDLIMTVKQGNMQNMLKWRYLDRIEAPIERRGLKNTRFTVIANTCIGASVYHKYGLPYTTPFISTLIVTEDYITLLEDLKGYLSQPIQFTMESKHPGVGPFYRKSFPVGVLGEGSKAVEIQFLHEYSVEEARAKWTRRLERVNFDNLFIMMTDSGNVEFGEPAFNMDYVRRFEALPFKNKVLFSHVPIDSPSVVYISDNMKGIPVVENMMYNRKYEHHMNVTKWLNTGR